MGTQSITPTSKPTSSSSSEPSKLIKTDVEAEKVSLQTGIESLKSRGRLSKDKKEKLAVMETRLKSLQEEAKVLEAELKQAPTVSSSPRGAGQGDTPGHQV